MTKIMDIYTKDGSEQTSRALPALEPGYFGIHELSFDNLLSMSAEISSLIHFNDLNNCVVGNWGEVFKADEAVIMALILNCDTDNASKRYDKFATYSYHSLFEEIGKLVLNIDEWYLRLSKCHHESAQNLASKIKDVITNNLVNEIHKAVRAFDLTDSQMSKRDMTWMSECGKVWKLDNIKIDSESISKDVDSTDGYEILRDVLLATLHAVSNSITYLKSIIPKYLEESLKSQQHNPEIGLFLVFLNMYQKAQNHSNKFTQRHLEFYYRKILKVKNRKKTKDCHYVKFVAQRGMSEVIVSKGAQLIAGKSNDGKNIHYRTKDDLLVTDAKVDFFATQYLQYDTLEQPESSLGYVTKIKTFISDTSHVNNDLNESHTGPILEHLNVRDDKSSCIDADIGFYIESAELILREGLRKIEVRIEFKQDDNLSIDVIINKILTSEKDDAFSYWFGKLFSVYILTHNGVISQTVKKIIQKYAQRPESKSIKREAEELLSGDWEALFYKLFKKIFHIRLTGENGWVNVDDYIISPLLDNGNENTPGFKIIINLQHNIEPIVAYNEEVHNENLKCKSAVLSCKISHESNLYPYSLFSDLTIKSIVVDTVVKELKNIVIYNQHGQLDPSKPFQPFGPLPGRSSYIVLGNCELATKHLSHVNLNIDWGELPECYGGFDEYYREYDKTISNSDLKLDISYLVHNVWKPEKKDNREIVHMFKYEQGKRILSSKITLPFDIVDEWVPVLENISEESYQYSMKSRNGFFKLSLSPSKYAFGHSEYPELLSKTMLENSKLKKPKHTPKQPYTPIINNISIDYSATSRVDLDVNTIKDSRNVKLIHKHPFGTEVIYPAINQTRSTLLPIISHRGSLLIGITGYNKPSTISLFIKMTEDLESIDEYEETDISWFYLSSNKWCSLDKSRVYDETTNGFISSGKIVINIPDDINTNNTVLPDNIYWIKVCTNNDPVIFTNVRSISLNVIQVENANRDINHSINVNSGWKLKSTIPGISSIKFLDTAYSGKSEENDSMMKIRMSERLRHKNRAVVSWDYERLILEKFSYLFKVKCFPHTKGYNEDISPGNILIVVVPGKEYIRSECDRSVLNIHQLYSIKEYVSELSPAFVNIDVKNPVYEKVQIRCTVKFSKGFDSGAYIIKLNEDLNHFISPWGKGGYKANFGWVIRQKDIESYIRKLDYVDFVTNLSLLKIYVDSSGKYNLFDTATINSKEEILIKSRYPWSLAIPVKKHFIETIKEERYIQDEITGINELEIGNTFIISGTSRHA